MINENQRCKVGTSVTSLKKYFVLIFWIHISESNFKSNKHIYKIRNQKSKTIFKWAREISCT